jgi:hypothetical protein
MERLLGEDADEWSAYEPATAVHYGDVCGRFLVPTTGQPGADGYRKAVTTLCDLGRSHGIVCTVMSRAGRRTCPCRHRVRGCVAVTGRATAPVLGGNDGVADRLRDHPANDRCDDDWA